MKLERAPVVLMLEVVLDCEGKSVEMLRMS